MLEVQRVGLKKHFYWFFYGYECVCMRNYYYDSSYDFNSISFAQNSFRLKWLGELRGKHFNKRNKNIFFSFPFFFQYNAEFQETNSTTNGKHYSVIAWAVSACVDVWSNSDRMI